VEGSTRGSSGRSASKSRVWTIEMAGHARYAPLLDACVLFPPAMGTALRNAVQFVV
jgi:hypothetical protein